MTRSVEKKSVQKHGIRHGCHGFFSVFGTVSRLGGKLLMVLKSGPSPVEVGSLFHCLQGFIHSRWLFMISEPSTVSILGESSGFLSKW